MWGCRRRCPCLYCRRWRAPSVVRVIRKRHRRGGWCSNVRHWLWRKTREWGRRPSWWCRNVVSMMRRLVGETIERMVSGIVLEDCSPCRLLLRLIILPPFPGPADGFARCAPLRGIELGIRIDSREAFYAIVSERGVAVVDIEAISGCGGGIRSYCVED